MTDFIPGKWYAFTGTHTGSRPEGAPAFVAKYVKQLLFGDEHHFVSALVPSADRRLVPRYTDNRENPLFITPTDLERFKIGLLDVEGVPVSVG